MPNLRRRLIELSFFLLTLTLFCGVSVYAVEGCDHNYVIIEEYPATCQTQGTVTYRCTECLDIKMDMTETLPHTWQEITRTEPTCTRPGLVARRCTQCTTEETVIGDDATGHSYPEDLVKAATCTEQGYTYHICEDCDYLEIIEGSYTDKLPHTYDSRIITEPTCQQEGYAEHTCLVCGDQYRESVGKVDHLLSEEIHQPTHAERGYTVFSCSYCGLVWLDHYTDKLPYDMVYEETAPTCTENGLRIGVCRDGCLHTESEILPAIGHNFGDDENEGWTLTREPSETLDGLEQRLCVNCGLTESRSIAYIPPPVEEPKSESNPLLLIAITGGGVMLIGILLLAVMIMLEHAGHKATRKYAVLSAVDKALANQQHR